MSNDFDEFIDADSSVGPWSREDGVTSWWGDARLLLLPLQLPDVLSRGCKASGNAMRDKDKCKAK